jgi:chemotaxis response regulator CheB
MPVVMPRMLLIGASTKAAGARDRAGPDARRDRPRRLITSHMPPMFMAIFSEYLERELQVPVHGRSMESR